MLHLLDGIFTIIHLLIIVFNLFGWIWKATRKWHLVAIGLTAASWILLGIRYGLGYCPITDWQWQVKARLGETDLPASFIKYAVDQLTRMDMNSSVIDLVTAGAFAAAAVMGVYVNFFKKEVGSRS